MLPLLFATCARKVSIGRATQTVGGPRRIAACRLFILCVAALGLAAVATADLRAGEPTWADERGRELFVRDWKPYDAQAPDGDGLGPMYNAQSCVECHHQGGVGGGGGSMHDVELLCLVPPQRNPRLDLRKRRKLVEGIGKIHPALVRTETSALPAITVHKFGEHPAYEKWRVALMMLVDYLPPGEVPDRISFQLAKRNTPALFGAGLIDSIPREALEKAAQQQALLESSVKGKLAPATGGGVGKFGWRGQTASLKQFVTGACANELGLNVPDNDQPLDPLDPRHKSPGLDLTQKQCDLLVAYVASLPAPEERAPKDRQQEEHWAKGARLFERVGCAECHLPELGGIVGIYSDLLLHDMGSELADRAAANLPGAPNPFDLPRSPGSSSRYYGGPDDIFGSLAIETTRQWRTPPLWGVGDSAPYLHDGRAETLDDAILAHGGEAATSREKYAALSIQRRNQLLDYLESVGHPAPLFD